MNWKPDQYKKFQSERSQPFFDLMDLLREAPGARVVDLGCGTGELTKVLHERTHASLTLGLDNSASMLQKATSLSAPGLTFESADIGHYEAPNQWNIIFSNAALQWCPDHPALFGRLRRSLGKNGQLAVQMPMNHDHPSHAVARAVASENPERNTLEENEYEGLLTELGFKSRRVEMRTYTHKLESRESVIEWVKGTTLTWYENRFSPEHFQEFMKSYREELFKVLPDDRPFVYPFKRILIWGSL